MVSESLSFDIVPSSTPVGGPAPPGRVRVLNTNTCLVSTPCSWAMRAIKAWMKPMSSMFSSLAGNVASLWQSARHLFFDIGGPSATGYPHLGLVICRKFVSTHFNVHGRYPLQTSKIRGGDEAEVHRRWKILMIVETMLFGKPQCLFFLETENVSN